LVPGTSVIALYGPGSSRPILIPNSRARRRSTVWLLLVQYVESG
jgi:hypothetical protein